MHTHQVEEGINVLDIGECWTDLYQVANTYGQRERIGYSVDSHHRVIHGFNNLQILSQLLDYGFYVSIGVSLLNPLSPAFRELQHIPLLSLFLESDDAKVRIEEIYGAAAAMLGITTEDLRKVL